MHRLPNKRAVHVAGAGLDAQQVEAGDSGVVLTALLPLHQRLTGFAEAGGLYDPQVRGSGQDRFDVPLVELANHHDDRAAGARFRRGGYPLRLQVGAIEIQPARQVIRCPLGRRCGPLRDPFHVLCLVGVEEIPRELARGGE